MKPKLPCLTLTLIVLTVLLSAASSLLGNAIELPATLKPLAPILFLSVALVLCIIAIWQYFRQKQTNTQVRGDENPITSYQHHLDSDRRAFLGWLNTHYAKRWKQLLEGAEVIIPGLLLKSFDQGIEQERPQPVGTTIVQVYDMKETRGDFLILGAPGAGKSTLLLILAVALRTRAEQDPLSPMPIIVSLSSWSKKTRSFEEWFVEETSQRYNMPSKLIERWLHVGQLLPLLDGLDEVPSSTYDACIQAINTFRKNSTSFIPLVVCSRSRVEFEQSPRLPLHNVVIILPLEDLQIREYCKAAGIGWVLHNNPELRELVKLPLMLHILTLAYQNTSARIAPQKETPEKLRQEIFDRYLQHVLAQRQRSSSWSTTQTKHWLAWIARYAQKDNMSVFSLENFTPTWLPETQRAPYRWIVRLIFIAAFALVNGLFAYQFSHEYILFVQPPHCPPNPYGYCPPNWWTDDIVGNLFKFLIDWLARTPVGMVCCVIIGALFGLSLTKEVDLSNLRRANTFTRLWEGKSWSWKDLRKKNWEDWKDLTKKVGELILMYVFFFSIFFFVGFVLGTFFNGSLTSHFIIGLLIAAFLWIMPSLMIYFASLTLRFLFWSSECLPWNIVAYLDECVLYTLLYKENNQYRFIHNLFRDYLASHEE